MNVQIPEKTTPLLARMAEALYWAGRYLERAEDIARVVNVHGETHVDLPVGEDVGWFPLLDIADAAALFAEQFPQLKSAKGAAVTTGSSVEDRIIRFLLFDQGNPSSIVTSVFNARSNLRQARPVVPREAWELCNELWTVLKDSGKEVRTRDERVWWLRTVVDQSHRINGVLLGTMRRDEALSFLRLGQQIERASITCRVLAVRTENLVGTAGADPYVDAHLMAVLRSLASYQPFRRAARSGEDARALVMFLLRDPYLPRSVSACLAELRDLVKALPRNESALEGCADASVAVVAAPILELDPSGLRSFLVDLLAAIGSIHHQIADSYFASAPARPPSRAGQPISASPVQRGSPVRSTDGAAAPGTIRDVELSPVSGPVGMRCRIVHLTTYDYDQPVVHAYNEAHLHPRDDNGQRCLSHQLEVTPAPVACTEIVDPFGNRVAVFSVQGGFDRLSVEATSEVTTSAPAPPPTGPPWESVRVMLDIDRQPAGRDARRYRAPSRLVPAGEPFRQYAAKSFLPSRPMVDATLDLVSRIHRDFVYEPGVTTITTPLLEVLENGRGVCQDFAQFMIACLRSLGLAARYVSGYIPTAPSPQGAALEGADASHAWVSVYLPGWGWIDVDPTNDQMVKSSHVTTAWGRDYWDVSPLRGSVEGGGQTHQLNVLVSVETLPMEGYADPLEA